MLLKTIVPCAIAGVVSFCILYFCSMIISNNLIGLLIFLSLSFVVIVLCAYCIGLSHQEKKIIENILIVKLKKRRWCSSIFILMVYIFFLLIFIVSCIWVIKRYYKKELGVFQAPFIFSLASVLMMTPQFCVIISAPCRQGVPSAGEMFYGFTDLYPSS